MRVSGRMPHLPFMGARQGRPTGKLGFLALAVGVVVIAVTGCSPTVSADGPTAMELYPEPIDLANARAACLVAKGWGAEVDAENASIHTLVPTGLDEAFQQDDFDCLQEIGVEVGRDLTDEEYATLYRQYSELATCLEDLGYPRAQSPSEQSFRDSYMSDPWVPWLVVPPEQMSVVTEECTLPPPVY